MTGKPLERPPDLGVTKEGRRTDDRHRVVRRKVVTIVLERGQVKRVNECARRVARNDVHLLLRKRTVNQRQIHATRLAPELEPVCLDEPRIAVIALQEFVAEARSPSRRHRFQIVDRAQAESLRIVAANEDREGVVEPERARDGQAGARV